MEITGQTKEDVSSVLQKFGGDEDLAVSELMSSACFFFCFFFSRVNEFVFSGRRKSRRMPRCSAGSETRLTDGFSAIAVHKFVDVKTKKSKEVRVRSSEIREPQSRDRFRRFVFSFFFSSCPAPSNKNSKKKEERAHRRGPKRTVERTNGDNSSFPRIAIKSTTRLSVSFSLLFFTTTEWREEVGQQRSQREQRPETRSRQKKRRTVVLFNETGQSASGI